MLGLCQNALYLGLNWVAMQWIEAGLASIIAATMPMIVAVLGFALMGERLSLDLAPGTSAPAQIEDAVRALGYGIAPQAVPGAAYRFLFAAKGGGSTSRTSLSMESPAILEASRFKAVLEKRIENLGTAGCPPYTIGVVLGGATPSQTMKTLELAVYGLHDALPGKADGSGMALRSAEWERIALELAAGTGLGKME